MISAIRQKARTYLGKPTYSNLFDREPGTEPPNPLDYPTNDIGVPIVPRGDIVGTFNGGRVLSRNDDSDGRRRFLVRECVPGHNFLTDDLFAYKMQSGHYGVYQVVDHDEKCRGGYIMYARDIGYLEPEDSTA